MAAGQWTGARRRGHEGPSIGRERTIIFPPVLPDQPVQTIFLIKKCFELAGEFGMARQKRVSTGSLARFDRLKVSGQDFEQSPLVSRISGIGVGLTREPLGPMAPVGSLRQIHWCPPSTGLIHQ